MSKKRLMKDGLGHASILRIADGLNRALPDFDKQAFLQQAMNGLGDLELKERVSYLIKVLHGVLPSNFSDTANILSLIPKVWDYGNVDDPLRGFAAWPIIDYVSEYGLDAPEESLVALEKLTPLFTSELAIRPFIQQHFDLTYQQLHLWCEHKDEHVRRLVSEGTRPRLPWAMRLQEFVKDPSPIFPLLEKLKNDPSLYVRRSVANNLNDISKDHPDSVIALCEKWKEEATEHTDWITKHATRSLVKQGHPEVFTLLGYNRKPLVSVNLFSVAPRQIEIGDTVNFEISLHSNKDNQNFVLGYAIHFVKANGLQSAKVFKLKNCRLKKGELITIQKKHSFKPITTRKYYSGEHAISIMANGVEIAKNVFTLMKSHRSG